MRTVLTNIWKRIVGIRRDCQGFVVVSTLAIFLFLFILCAFVYAVGETIHQRIKMQNACDAAAYSAAVVQADGLSRMATVNRAMAWSYVQMTNRQMDYITYRWLKLTCKRFEEDRENAKNYAEQLIFAVDKELGWWAILEALVTAPISALLGDNCDSGGHKKYDTDCLAWWCGLEHDKPGQIKLNQRNDFSSLSGAVGNIVGNVASEALLTFDLIKKVVNNPIADLIDKNGDNEDKKAENWGYYLGLLIDYDKANIKRMNKALERINVQMTVSMKLTAENVLKSMLKDNRLDEKQVLKDYYISIHIPEGKNPYENLENVSSASASFFSPLRNTEADERIFLQMHSSEKADGNLAVQFPILGVGTLAYGLDQWFVRGKGVYNKSEVATNGNSSYVENKEVENEEYCYAAQKKYPTFDGSVSGWVRDDIRLLKTERSEGALGIQRVYKDTNLNEGKAGFFSTTKETVENRTFMKTHVSIKDRHDPVRANHIKSLPKCCYEKHNDDGKRVVVYAHEHITYETVYTDNGRAVNRGNHVLSLTDALGAGFDAAKNFFADSGESGELVDPNQEADEGLEAGDISAENADELAQAQQENQERYNQQIRQAEAENNQLREKNTSLSPQLSQAIDENERKRLSDEIAANNAAISKNNENIANWKAEIAKNKSEINDVGNQRINQDSSKANSATAQNNSPGSILGNIATSVVDQFVSLIDIAPSCDNVHSTFSQIPMCSQANETTALYSEYRWASGKWYCLTKLWTWAVCTAFRKDIYCDRNKKTLKKIGFIKLRGRGHGHFCFPKWFCGAHPTHPADGAAWGGLLDWLLKYFPPLIEDIEDSHGYMKKVYDFSSDGFLRPILPLFGRKRNFERDEYQSCATFPDGSFNFATGSKAHAGLIRGHARIYGDDKEIFDNRYVGAMCKPWVLNERFFAGDGTIVVGAAMRHTNPFVQLFNMWNTKVEDNQEDYKTGTETQEDAENTVLSAFNIPKDNFMWTMSAARAGVRHRRRDGAFDQERQYQITYDSTSDVENLKYSSGKYVLSETADNNVPWISPEEWGSQHTENPYTLSRIHFPSQTHVPVWDGCVCVGNAVQLKNLWNLCETDWDATLIPLRYAGQRAVLYLSKGSGNPDLEDLPFDELDYQQRSDLLDLHLRDDDTYSEVNGKTEKEKVDMVIGNGKSWKWHSPLSKMSTFITSNPFLNAPWKKANATFFEELLTDSLPGNISYGISTLNGLNLQNKIPTGKEEKKIDIFTIFMDKVL